MPSRLRPEHVLEPELPMAPMASPPCMTTVRLDADTRVSIFLVDMFRIPPLIGMCAQQPQNRLQTPSDGSRRPRIFEEARSDRAPCCRAAADRNSARAWSLDPGHCSTMGRAARIFSRELRLNLGSRGGGHYDAGLAHARTRQRASRSPQQLQVKAQSISVLFSAAL